MAKTLRKGGFFRRIFGREKKQEIEIPVERKEEKITDEKLKEVVRDAIKAEITQVAEKQKTTDIVPDQKTRMEIIDIVKNVIREEISRLSVLSQREDSVVQKDSSMQTIKGIEKKNVSIDEQVSGEQELVTVKEKVSDRMNMIFEEDLDEGEKHIMALERKLREKRIALQKALEYKEKELEMIRKMLDNERKQLMHKDEEISIREKKLKEQEAEITKKLETINLAKKDLEEQMKLLKELEQKWEGWKGDREKLIKGFLEKGEDKEKQILDDDIKKLLPILDELLGELPDEATDRFTKSDSYKLYIKVLDKYGVS